MKLSFHSFSDVITNSSETVYMCPTEKTISMMKELINYFLEKAGSDKRADDLFTFELELDEAYVERILDDIDSNQLQNLVEEPEHLPHKELLQKQEEAVRKLVKEGKINADDYDNDYSFRADHLLIIPKDNSKEVLDMTSKVFSIFNVEATRDG
jgi:hypothetical protein